MSTENEQSNQSSGSTENEQSNQSSGTTENEQSNQSSGTTENAQSNQSSGTTENAQSSQSSGSYGSRDTIFIGKKPLMAYVTSTLIQLDLEIFNTIVLEVDELDG